MTDILQNKRALWTSNEFKIRFLIFAAIIALFAFPIIHANVIFADDNLRVMKGRVSLGDNGRTYAELLFYILHASDHIADAGSLFQIASIFILAAPITLLSLLLKYDRLSSFATLPFIACTPFFLSNLSFRYDSLSMSLSLALAILAVCAQIKHKYLYTVLCVLAVLSFYQSSFNAFLVLSCLAALWCLFEEGEKAAIIYVSKALGCGFLALILYKIQLFLFSFLPGHAFKMGDYAASLSGTNYHFSHVLKNIGFGLESYCSYFTHRGVFLPLGFGVIAGVILLFGKTLSATKEKEGKKKVLFPLCAMIIFAISVVSLIGPMAILQTLPLNPMNMVFATRVMVGFGAFLALCLSFFIGREAVWKGWKIASLVFAFYLLFQVILGSFVYGTVLAEENEFDTKITDEIISSAYKLVGNKPVFVRYIRQSNLPFSPQTSKARELQPWINDILDNSYTMYWHYLKPRLWQARGAPASMDVDNGEPPERLDNGELEPFFSVEEAEKIRSSCEYDHIIQKRFYAMYQKGDKIVVDFSSNCPKSF